MPLLAELDEVAHALERLIAVINATNSETRLPSGATLTEALARRDVLGVRHAALKTVADATAQQQARYSRSEIRLVRTFDVGEGAGELTNSPASAASSTSRYRRQTGRQT